MSKIKNYIFTITAMEELTNKNTPIHRLDPTIKLITTAIFLTAVISYGPYEVSSLIPCFFYPVILMTLGEIPWKPLLQRLIIAIPFSLFTGISNLIFSREYIAAAGKVVITSGMVSFGSIILKTILVVMAVLILIATTGMNDLLYAMRKLRIPSLFILQIMMTFRYLGVIAEEVSVMYHAYILRAPNEKGIKLKDIGSFMGQLLIRSFDRAERIYHAMKCRGFNGTIRLSDSKKIDGTGWFYLFLVGGGIMILRFINLSYWIGRFIV